jgi:hypothetical protein
MQSEDPIRCTQKPTTDHYPEQYIAPYYLKMDENIVLFSTPKSSMWFFQTSQTKTFNPFSGLAITLH